MDKGSAVEDAVRAVIALVEDADGREMVGRRKPKDPPPMEADSMECEACKRGECSDPEHASDDDLSEMMGA